MPNPLAADLDHVLLHSKASSTGKAIWEELRGKKIFITGGTGFFGRWLLESFVWANDKLNLNATVCVLTRDPTAFQMKAPHLAEHRAVKIHPGDFTSFEFPQGDFYAVVHAATKPAFAPDGDQPLGPLDANMNGTRRVLEFARASGVERFLFTSSGAAYGRQPPDLTHLSEEYVGAPDTTDTTSAYGQSKRACEFMCSIYARQYGFAAPIARCFAFAGPHLPLDLNFAMGNFVRDALRGGPIQIAGDGTPRRSYLYAADLAIWLWAILVRGQSCRLYNVGSSYDLSIADLAKKIALIVAPGARVKIATEPLPGAPPLRYVPCVERAEKELGLRVWIPLEEAIRRMSEWAVLP